MEVASSDPNINSVSIAILVKERVIYWINPPMSHFRSIKRELNLHLATTRSVYMAGMKGYVHLLNSIGHKVE